MSPSDEQEMHRLCEMLGAIAATLPESSPLQECLQKAAMAVQIAFIDKRREWIENMYNLLQDPNTELTPEKRAQLIKLGIDPDANDPE